MINLKSNPFVNLILQVFFVGFVAFMAVRLIPITLFDEKSYVSVVASALLFLFVISFLSVAVILIIKKNKSNHEIYKNLLSTSWILYLTSSGLAVAIFVLAQSGTPFPPGALLGDMGNYLLFALGYQESGSLNYGYPPGISWLMITFSEIFDASPVAVFKHVYIFLV